MTRERAQSLPDRDGPEVRQVRSVVESEYGSALDALTALRDQARDDLNGFDAELLLVDRPYVVVVLGIYSRALTYLDCIRVLVERGYGEEALGLARSIYESEADAHLLFARPGLLDRYTDFEFYRLCLNAARIAAAGRLAGPQVDEQLERWRHELRDLAQRRELDLPPDFADADLLSAVQMFSRERFGRGYRGSWRYDMPSWERDILPVVVEAHERIVDPSAPSEQIADRLSLRVDEHDLFYRRMSEELHGAPHVVAERVQDYPAFRLGGDPRTVPSTMGIAVGFFGRLRTLVRHLGGQVPEET